jgi:hypothetical protein
MPELFNKHDKPDLAGLTEEEAWAQVHAFEDYVYTTFSDDDTVSDEQWDGMIAEIEALYAEYYALFE